MPVFLRPPCDSGVPSGIWRFLELRTLPIVKSNKAYLRHVLIAAVLAFSLPAAPTGQFKTAGPPSDVDAARAADAALWDAVNACNADRWSSMVVDDVIFMPPQGELVSKVAWREDLFGSSLHPPCDTGYELMPLMARVNGDVAVLVGNMSLAANGKGRQQGRTWQRYTRVFIRTKGAWRLSSAQHNSIKEPDGLGVPASGHLADQLNKAEFERLLAKVSNRGRWGAADQLGTVNLLTPEKRKQAAALVKSGLSVSLSATYIEEKAADADWTLTKTNRGSGLSFENIHGGHQSHIDALCHFSYNGTFYNGFVAKEGTEAQGCRQAGIHAWKNGLVTRGVLIDMARFRRVPWLDPGTPVTLHDIEAWEKETGIKILPGDAIFLRTGRWARRAQLGTWTIKSGLIGPDAGFHWSVLPWLKARDVAIVGTDGTFDVRPPLVDKDLGILPLHTAGIAAMGLVVIDGQDLEAVGDLAAKLKRWDFMMMAAPLAIDAGSGSPINVIATF